MSAKPWSEIPDHEAIPLSVREGPVDLNAENYRLQILRHDREVAARARNDEAKIEPSRRGHSRSTEG